VLLDRPSHRISENWVPLQEVKSGGERTVTPVLRLSSRRNRMVLIQPYAPDGGDRRGASNITRVGYVGVKRVCHFTNEQRNLEEKITHPFSYSLTIFV
jgi:hypothetical protein